MEINFSDEAITDLQSLLDFVENINTPKAGNHFLLRFEEFIEPKFEVKRAFRLCNNLSLRKLNLCCIYFNNWVIAFTIK